jgi:catechol 2,3-dioxygenase-like lactoylglutathione lyase family enzyme
LRALGEIDQVGFVVPDLDAACARYAPLFGPWQRAESPLIGVLYRGVPTDVHLRLAFGHAAGLEMEFISVVSGASPHSEFLAAGREGIHHVRYPVANLAATLAALEPAGFVPIWSHALGPYKWAYCEHVTRDGVLIELLESPPRPAVRAGSSRGA